MTKKRGLYAKFTVERTDGSSGPGGKHDGCRYFVIDVTHDKHAAGVLEVYANAIAEENPKLYDDLNDLLATLTLSRGSCTGDPRKPQPKYEDRCRKPAVIALGNGVWLCVEHAPLYTFRGRSALSKAGKASLKRRVAKVKVKS
jgi:hypothetical protein